MGEGFVQLLFIIAIIVFSVVDATSRKGKRRRKMEEMEREEAREKPGRASHAPQPYAPEEPYLPEEEEEEERVTADQMVPDDLWAILTGQPAPTRREPQEPTPESDRSERGDGIDRSGGEYDSRGRRSAEEPPQQPHIPVPVPSDRTGSGTAPLSTAGGEEESTRRSGRWMEGVAGRGDTDRLGEFEFAEEEARIYATPPDPWGAMADIASSELADDGDLTRAAPGDEAPGDRRRWEGPSGRSAHYVELLNDGGRDGLRTAVLLKEILGRPVAYRATGLAWEDDR